MRKMRGFSLVELVVVIVLAGIVAVVVIPRYVGTTAFNASAVRDGLIATIRAAQQAAMGRDAVTFEIDASGGEWIFSAKAGGNTIRSFEAPTSNVILETGSGLTTSSSTCATGFDTAVVAGASAFQLTFNSQGNLALFTYDGAGPPTETVDQNANFNGVRICVNDVVANSVCVSPAGYAYAGNCDD